MSRIYKFRALLKDQHFKGWIYFDVFDVLAPRQDIDRETIGQFTGLTDKNGIEIYEGDLIKNKSGLVCDVDWHEGIASWRLFGKEQITFMEWDCVLSKSRIKKDKLEIIGNIYENPELLTPKDNQ